MYMTIDVTTDECTMRSKRLCTSPTHFRNILSDELMRFASEPSARFIYEGVSLREAGKQAMLAHRLTEQT